MTDIMMQIGDYPFSISTAAYETMKISHSWRWSKQDRIGRKPAKQFIGVDSQSIQLSGMILPAFRGGINQIADMRREADLGMPLILVDGLGNIWGQYVIESIDETQSHFTPYGVARKVIFDMSLSEYGDDVPDFRSSQEAQS